MHALLIVSKIIPWKGVKRLQLESEGEHQGYSHFSLLDVGYDGLLVSFSSPNSPASFAIVPFDVNKKGYAWLPEFRPSVIARLYIYIYVCVCVFIPVVEELLSSVSPLIGDL